MALTNCEITMEAYLVFLPNKHRVNSLTLSLILSLSLSLTHSLSLSLSLSVRDFSYFDNERNTIEEADEILMLKCARVVTVGSFSFKLKAKP